MKRRNPMYIIILSIFIFIFIWVIINIVHCYHIKISLIKNHEEIYNLYETSNNLTNQDVPWEIFLSPLFILITYYLIPYIIFVISFIKHQNNIIKENIKVHRKIYLSFILFNLIIVSYIYYKMITNIMPLFELFEYLNLLIPLGIVLYIILYWYAYLLGKHFVFSIKLLLKE